MMKMIQGEMPPANMLQTLGFPSPWKYAAVMVLQMDTLKDTRFKIADFRLVMFAINNIIEETIPERERFIPILHDPYQITLLLGDQQTEDEFSSHIFNQAVKVQNIVKHYLKISISIGISLPFSQLSAVANGYREGKEALKLRIKLESHSIITYQNIDRFSHMPYYPQQVTEELLEAVKFAERLKADRYLSEWVKCVLEQDLHPDEYYIHFTRLLFDLKQCIQELRLLPAEFHINKSHIDHLFGLTSPQEIEHWFKHTIVEPIILKIEERLKVEFSLISEQMIEIIHNEYDTNLTLTSMASRLHYNPSYLSTVFRKETGNLFSDYLASYRHSISKKWLVESDMTIKEISERLKYKNTQNYIRSFRRIEGVTPGKYRDLRHK
jgi:YesN/AraC family two-component response regulator